jgi:uncharacterized protein
MTAQLLAAAAAVLGRTAGPATVDTADGERLSVQRCRDCGRRRLPEARFCPDCLSTRAEWIPDDGAGTVWSVAVYHRAFDPAFADAVPYGVVLVELDSGPRLITNVLDLSPADLQPGLRVVVAAFEVRPGEFLPYARPARPEEWTCR